MGVDQVRCGKIMVGNPRPSPAAPAVRAVPRVYVYLDLIWDLGADYRVITGITTVITQLPGIWPGITKRTVIFQYYHYMCKICLWTNYRHITPGLFPLRM